MKLFEVKVLEKHKVSGLEPFALDGMFDYPKRYRFTNCLLVAEEGNVKELTLPGGVGTFEFKDGYCPKFRGVDEAWILEEIDESRIDESDRFIAA
jgi:hypothetical protein